MSHAEIPGCHARSQYGELMAVFAGGVEYAVQAQPDRWFICTRHPGHRGGHSACDGQGHVLASWPRRRPEQYWERCDHPHEVVS